MKITVRRKSDNKTCTKDSILDIKKWIKSKNDTYYLVEVVSDGGLIYKPESQSKQYEVTTVYRRLIIHINLPVYMSELNVLQDIEENAIYTQTASGAAIAILIKDEL